MPFYTARRDSDYGTHPDDFVVGSRPFTTKEGAIVAAHGDNSYVGTSAKWTHVVYIEAEALPVPMTSEQKLWGTLSTQDKRIVSSLVKCDYKIAAIRHVRQASSADLREAKEMVDAYEAGKIK